MDHWIQYYNQLHPFKRGVIDCLDRKLTDLQAGRAVSRRYRNRRIGEFLKELDLTEGRATGIPKILKVMAANGSPSPLFETDDEHARP